MGTTAQIDGEGLITADPDAFTPAASISRAYFSCSPSNGGGEPVSSPAEPWIHAEIKLPLVFGEITELRVSTVPVVIAPQFPRPAKVYESAVTEIDFVWAEDEEPPIAPTTHYRVRGTDPLKLEQVQPGAYWLRVRAAGAALGAWEKIQVDERHRRFTPQLKIGSTATVPLEWPIGLDPKALDPRIAGVWGDMEPFFRLERDGSAFFPAYIGKKIWRASPKEGLVFWHLPVGKYRLHLRSSDELREVMRLQPDAARRYPGWKSAEMEFQVSASTRPEFETKFLRIEGVP